MFTSIFLAFVFFALLRTAEAVVPPPDGGYPGGNTAEGQAALLSLTTGGFNTAVGWESLKTNTTGQFNTGIGAGTLALNTGDENTATGAAALLSNTAGAGNTANGFGALLSNTIGIGNTATGADALLFNTGSENTATGAEALFNNTTGINNTANGFGALTSNHSGNGNTAIGRGTLSANAGDGNTALGTNAGNALTTGVNNIDIGVDVIGVAGESNTIRIGNTNVIGTFIRGISGNIATGGATVYVESDGHLGTLTSSARFKDEIKPMGNVSEAILALKPVTFHYKSDAKNTPCFGLIAEEVEKVNPDLVVRDSEGRPYTVRYEQINAMLLNEFLKEHKKVERQLGLINELNSRVAKQDVVIAEQQKGMEALSAQLQEQALQVQKVSAQIEVRNPPSKTVATISR